MSQSITNDQIKLVIFELSSEEFGVEITKINSILRMENITKIPDAADFIEGIINFRGKPLVVVNLKKRFNFPVTSTNEDNMRIIVLDFQPFLVGIIVDNVSEVLNLPFENIEPVPDNLISLEIEQEFLLGVGNISKGERLIVLLDLAKVFSGDEIEDIGMIFGQEQEIKQYLELTKDTKEKSDEDIRLKASQAALLAETLNSGNFTGFNKQNSREKLLEREQTMIRRLALQDLQQELGINLNDNSEEEIIYLEDGQEIEEEEGVEYIYVDEDGNEINPDDFNNEPIIKENTEIFTENFEDDDVAALIAAAEEDLEQSTKEPLVIKENEKKKGILTNKMEESKNIKKFLIESELTKVLEDKFDDRKEDSLSTEQKENYSTYLHSLTKAKVAELSQNYLDFPYNKKDKKETLISSFLGYLVEYHPEIIKNFKS